VHGFGRSSLDTLDEPDSSSDAKWAQEAQSRMEAYRRGEVQAIPLNEVIAKYLVFGDSVLVDNF